MENKRQHYILIKNQKGQSTVEYLLLLVVIVSFMSVVMQTAPMKKLFGDDKSIYKGMARRMEFSYRYGFAGTDDDFSDQFSNIDYMNYKNQDNGDSRFFGPTTKHNE